MVFENRVNTNDLSEVSLYLGKSLKVKGTLYIEGSGRIDGNVEGKITVKGTLVLGEESSVSPEIEGDTVIIGGSVQGKIVGRERVELVRSSVVNAVVTTPRFSIEDGAHFNGSCQMGDKPSP